MKYEKILALVMLGFACGSLIGVSATAQEPAQKKHIQATEEFQKAKESAQKQASVYQEKIQALRESLETLGKKRAELAKAKGKESNEVADLTVRMDKLKKQAVELREMAKQNAVAKSSKADDSKIQIAKKELRAKQIVDKQKMSRSGDVEKDQAKIRKPAQVAEAKKSNAHSATAHSDDRPMIGGGKANLQERKHHSPEQVDERRVIVRKGEALKEKRPADGSGAQHFSESDRERQRSERGPERELLIERTAGPGPVEVTRRLHVLEDRLNAIERKLDEILDRLSARGPRADDDRSERGPRPVPRGPEPRERREDSPPGVDRDQFRRPPMPDEPPSPPRRDGPPRS